jgi:GLPGLI family protein
MKKKSKLASSFILILIVTCTAYAQQNTGKGLNIIYQTLTIFDLDSTIVNNVVATTLKETSPINSTLLIKENNALYYENIELSSDLVNNRSFEIRRIISNEGYQSIKYNTNTQKVIKHKFTLGTNFCINSNFADYIWAITSETKMIDKYKCYKATLKKQVLSKDGGTLVKEVTAYFAPELPFSLGPLGYCGLPGLILELIDSSKNVRMVSLSYINNNKLNYPSINNKCQQSFNTDLELDTYLSLLRDR